MDESSEEKMRWFTAQSLAQHLLNHLASGAGEEEGRAVAKRPITSPRHGTSLARRKPQQPAALFPNDYAQNARNYHL